MNGTAEEFDQLVSDAAREFEKNMENAERLFVQRMEQTISMLAAPQSAFEAVPFHLRRASIREAMNRAQSEADRVYLALREWDSKGAKE